MISCMHETIWNPKATGTAPPTRPPVVGKRFDGVGCCPESRFFPQFGNSVEGPVQKRWAGRLETQACSRPFSQAEFSPEGEINQDSFERSFGLGFFHRPVDPKEGCPGNRKGIRRGVPPQPPVAISDSSGLELPEAGETSPGKKPGEYRSLETLDMAPYKKKPKNWKPIWSSWMKVGFSWCPTWFVPGRRKEKHPIFLLPDAGQKSRLSRRFLFPRKDERLRFTPSSTATKTSVRPKWSGFSNILTDTCANPSSCSGTAAHRTRVKWSRNSWPNIPVSMSTGSPDMLPSLIPMSLSGTNSNDPWPIALPKTWLISGGSFNLRFKSYGSPKNFFGHAFRLQVYHGRRLSIVYA